MKLIKINETLLALSFIFLVLFILTLSIQDTKQKILELEEYIIINDVDNEYYHNKGCTDMLLLLNISLNPTTTNELYQECKIK